MATANHQLPLDSELAEHTAWYISLRWWAVGGMLLGTWLIAPACGMVLPQAALTVVALTVFCANVFFFSRLRRAPEPRSGEAQRKLLYAQWGIDWLALIVLVYYTGGVRSPVTLAFSFHLVLATLLMTRAMCYTLLGLIACYLIGTAWLEQAGHVTGPEIQVPYLGADPAAAMNSWIVALLLLYGATVLMGTTIAARLRARESELSKSEAHLARANAQLIALHELGQLVNGTLDVQQLLALLAEHGTRLLGMRGCAIRVLNADDNILELGGTFGLSKAYLNKGRVPVTEGSCDAATLAGKVVVIDDIRTDPRVLYPVQARAEGLHAVLCVPMNAGDEALGVVRLYARDAHAFSQEEQTMAQNLANLGAVAIKNARAYTELERANTHRDWFARTTHHELRAPLAAVRSMLDAVLLMKPSAREASFVERARDRVDTMLELICDLLELAGASQHDLTRPQPSCMQTVFETCLAQAKERAIEKEVTFAVALPDQPVYLRLGQQPLSRIVGNLLDNAVKYSKRKGEVSITIRREANGLRFDVQDQGIGISPKDQERVFKGFYRTEQARATGQPGTGLGLSIVRQLIIHSGGTIEVSSVLDEGACFTITWPESSLAVDEPLEQEKEDHA